MSSNFLSVPTGNERPFSSLMTTTAAVALVTAGDNGARVTLIRAAEIAGTSVTTLRLDVLNAAGTSSVQIRGAKALTAHEVYQDYDVRLLRGEVLRATASTSTGVNITGLYVENPRGSL